MTTTLTERELAFTFPAAWQAERFDQPGVPLPKHIMPVDFVVERPDDILLIEVKDPSASRAPAKEQQEYLRRMASDQLTHEELVPKARTTWSYLHLMARTGKPLRFVVAVGTDRLSVQPLLLQSLTDKLRRRLAQEADVPWKVPYIASCMVVPALDLGNYLTGVGVARVDGA